MKDFVQKDIESLKFLSQKEVDFLNHISPSGKEMATLRFQEALRGCLQEYLGTPFLLSFKHSKSTHELRTWGDALDLEIAQFDRNTKIKDLPKVLKHGYRIFEEHIESLEAPEDSTIDIPLLEHEYYDSIPILNKFVAFVRKEMRAYLKTAIIHGSCADLELTPFSDLDTFFVIKNKTIQSAALLIQFKKQWRRSLNFLYRFDALQHHDHMIATEYDLNRFPYHWLPPQIFKESILIEGDQKLKIKVKNCTYSNTKVFFELAQRFRNPIAPKKIHTEYSLKNDISILSLLPVLFLQVKGINATKKESFTHKALLSIDSDTFFKEISRTREQWKVTKSSNFFISKRYNYYLRKVYLKFFAPKSGNGSITHQSRLAEGFLESLNALIDKMSANFIHEIKSNG